MQNVILNIQGYWREENKTGIPPYPGIFFAFETKYNTDTGTVSPLKLLHVGEGENLRERIATHPSVELWKSMVNPGNELSYAVAPMAVEGRTRVKAALIYRLKPRANEDFKTSLPYAPVSILLTGQTGFLPKKISV